MCTRIGGSWGKDEALKARRHTLLTKTPIVKTDTPIDPRVRYPDNYLDVIYSVMLLFWCLIKGFFGPDSYFWNADSW